MKKLIAALLCLGILTSPLTVMEEVMAASASPPPAEVVTYAKPEAYALPDGAVVDRQGKYTVTVNDKPIDLYPALEGLAAGNAKTAKSAYGYFDFTGSVTVKITTDFDFSTVTVRPLSQGIQPQVDGRTVTFTLASPSNLSVEFDGNLQENLHLFSNYIETPDFGSAQIHYVEPGSHSPKDILASLDAGKANVVYFKPGVHILPSNEIFYIPSNTTVYVAGGAVVYGRLHGQDASNIRILGRGVINGSKLDRRADFGDGPQSYLMRFVRCTNVEINGIILQDSPHWTLVNIECEKVNIRNFRIVGQRRSNNDGMDIVNCRNFTVDHSFVRTIDDAITVKGKYIGGERNQVSNITVQNSVIWNEDSGNAQEIGFETLTDKFSNIIFRNNDVIHNNSGGTMTMHNGDTAVISGVVNDDIRVEGKTNNGSLVEMFIRDTYYSTSVNRGSIDGVTFNRINYMPQDDRASTMNGYDANSTIKNVSFHDLLINGKQITGPYEAGKGQISYDQYVQAPTFSADPVKFDPLPGTALYEGENLTVSGASSTVRDSAMANSGKYADVDLAAAGNSAQTTFTAPAGAHYIPIINVRKGPDGGVVKILVDGKDHGYWMDTYSNEEVWQAYTLTDLYLAQGAHTLTFQAASNHLNSTGYHFGFDYLNLTMPDDTTYEAENAASAVANGQASCGYYANLPLQSGQAALTVPVASDRISNLKLRLLTGPDKGRVNLMLDGNAQGNVVDLYSETASFKEFSFDTARLSAGNHSFVLKSTDQKDSALELDYVKFGAFPSTVLWRARRLYNNTYYSTTAATTTTVGDTYDTNSTVTSLFTKTGDWANYIVTVPADGFYTVAALMDAGPDKGSYKILADGAQYDSTSVDAYQATAGSREFKFGAVYLHYGENNLRFECTGKNALSSGYALTLNAIKLEPGVLTPASEDSYTFSDATSSDKNFGTEQLLTIKQGAAGGGGERRSYIKYDLSAFGSKAPETAELRFTAKEFDADFQAEYRTLELYAVPGSWQETSITWNNQPAKEGAVHLGTVKVPAVADSEYSVDISEYLRTNWSTLGGSISLMLTNETDGADQKSRMSIYSRESGDKGPQLWTSSRPIVAKSFSVEPDSVTMWPGTTRELTAALLPANADANIVWQSNNESVATVNSRGIITAHAEGTAQITVNLNDGQFTDTVAVTVVPKEVYDKTLTPKADTYAWSDTKDTNYGKTTELIVKALNNGGGGRKSLLAFDFSDYGGSKVERAVLRLCLKSTDEVFGKDYRTLSLSAVNEKWEELGATWNVFPKSGESIASFQVGRALDQWYEIDVTDYINQNQAKLNGRASFLVDNTTDGADQKNKLSFYSRESGSKAPQLVMVGEGGEALPRLTAKTDFAVANIWSDGEVQTDDSLQVAVEQGRATVTMNGANANALADATERYNIGGEVAMPKDGQGVTTIALPSDFSGSRTIQDMDILMRTGASDAKAYNLELYYSTTAHPDTYKMFYSNTNKNALNFEVYPYIRLSGFDGQVSDVANIRVVSTPVDGDAPVLQEIDMNFTQDDTAVAAAKQAKKETLRMPTLFSNDMVLQRNKAIRVWGWGGKDNVSVSLTKQGESTPASQATATVQDGKWLAELPALEGGNTQYTLTVTSNGKSLTFTGVLIGDVYLASGQSNMALFVKDSSTRDKDVAAANDENIRFFTQDFAGACNPKDDIPTGKWSKAVGSTIDNYYAVAYHFAKEISDKTSGQMPVAVLSAATPGTFIECWMDETLLNSVVGTNPGKTYLNDYRTKSKADLTRAADYERRAVAPYNSMMNPLTNSNIAGILWYQGENNSGMVDSYRAAFPLFISNLRSKFRDKEQIPFITVQLPAFAAGPSGWSNFRLMQDEVVKQTTNAYLTVTIDCADNPNNIHPTNKTVVGQRAAAIMLNKIYGQNVVYSGPEFSGAELQGNKLILSFGGSADGLNTKVGDTVYGFEISEDGVNFAEAQGKLVNGKVEVSSPDIAFPQFIRYACEPYPSPMANLYNSAGFPTAPFTADVSSDAVYVKLSANAATLYPTVTKQLSATVLPADRPQTITWSSSDKTVATVDQNGLVTAVSAGTAQILATSSTGAYSSATITVKPWEKFKQTQSPTDDAFVYDYEQTGNHGTDTQLTVKPVYINGSGERRSYLKFDFSSYGGEKLQRAVLRLCLKEADSPFPNPPLTGSTDRTVELYLTSSGWKESSLAWGNQPDAGVHIATFQVSPTLDNWCEIDLTDALNANRDKLNGILSLQVKNITNGADQKSRISFYSKESGDKGPQLILEGQNVYTTVTSTVTASTQAGTAPILPGSVAAKLTTGASVQAPVIWDEIPGDKYQNPGSFTVLGHIAGYDGTVEATVTVTQASEQLDKAALAQSISKAQQTKLHYPANLSEEIRKQFEAALNHANEVYSNSQGTFHQKDIDDAVSSLNKAADALFAANLKKLEDAIAHAQTVISSGSYKDDEVMQQYRGALQAAAELKKAGKLTDEDLSPALQLLTKTEAELHKVTPQINLSALKNTISSAQGLNLAQYQDGTEKQSFQKELANAKSILSQAGNGNTVTQADVDKAVQALEKAMSALKKVEEPKPEPGKSPVVLADEKNKVQVSAGKGVLTEGTKLSVHGITSGQEFELADKTLEDIGDRYTLWDISLLKDNVKVQPNGVVTVSLPVPAGYDINRMELYRINSDSTRDQIAFTVSNGMITFNTNHFSLYTVVETQKESPKPVSPPTGETPLTSPAALALISGTVLPFLKKRKRKN